MKRNSKKSVKLMEFYQIPKSDRGMITDTIWMIWKATVMVMEETSIPIKFSKPFSGAGPGACPVGLEVGPPSILVEILVAELFSNLDKKISALKSIQSQILPTTTKLLPLLRTRRLQRPIFSLLLFVFMNGKIYDTQRHFYSDYSFCFVEL